MKRISLVATVATLALLATATTGFAAREVYVPDYEADAVFVLDATTGAQIGAPIATGVDSAPYTLAISPDGNFVYTTNEDNGTVGVIDTRTKAVVGSITVGKSPFGIAITPDGSRAFVSNPGDKTVSAIDLATRQTIGAPIPVGENAFAVAISPDGSRVFVPNSSNDNVTVIDAKTLQVIGLPIPVGDNPYGLAVTPDGARVLVANNDDASLTAIDAKTLQAVGVPIPVGNDPSGVTVSANGRTAYVGNFGSDTVSVVDLGTNQVAATIPGVPNAEFVALTPTGQAGFVSENVGVAGLNLATNQLTGAHLKAEGAGQLAIVPDQSPTAAFQLQGRARPGVPAAFNASGSSDSDGTVGLYTWAFPTGASGSAGPKVRHSFPKPGKYSVTLTVTDNEGCSVATVFTGQTAYCNGNPAATITKTVTVAYPGLKAKCPKRAKFGCAVAIQAVKWQGKGKKRRLVAQSAMAKATLKAGFTKILSVKPKKSARTRLAKAKRILVAQAVVERKSRSEGVLRVRVAKLKVVR